MRDKVIVVVGPTASGKSALGVMLAKKFDGEIISADSRQVYRGFDIGAGKFTKREQQGVHHHLLDIASPKRTYSAAHFKRDAVRAVRNILKRKKVPIIVGGTGFYIDTLLYDTALPDVLPNTKLRSHLSKKTPAELLGLLKKLDPKRARVIEQKNPRRLVRAIEIATALGKVPPLKKRATYNMLLIGIRPDDNTLRKKIRSRLLERVKRGMIGEIAKLRRSGLSWRRLENFGLEYRYVSLFLQKKLSKEEMLVKLENEIYRYAKRQMRWFKRDDSIKWHTPNDRKLIQKEVKKFLE